MATISTTTWNAATLEWNGELGADLLTYSSGGYSDNMARAVVGLTAGRWYWELRIDQLASNGVLQVGVATANYYSGPGAPRTDYFPSGAALSASDVLGIALDLDAGTIAIAVNGVEQYTFADLLDEGSGVAWYPCVANQSGGYPPCIVVANFGALPFAYPVPSGYTAGVGTELGDDRAGWLLAPSVLELPAPAPLTGWMQAPSVLDRPKGAVNIARLSVESPLTEALSALASNPAGLGPAGWARLPSLLSGSPARVRLLNDFTGVVGDAISVFVMDLVTPTGAVRVPISSWQATLQTGSSNYVQCVIPASTFWAEAINAATEFVVFRRAVLPSGAAAETEMARAPAGQLQFDRGPERHTCTMSGYSEAFAADSDPPQAYDRHLTGVRSISSGSSCRVRCAIDWLLRPGQRAIVSGAPFIVKFINYYAPSSFDSYMDVGG